ncbi:ABC transporter permease [Jeotgalibaca sp. MA1X17-3]|uniref:ABC transporter permease n=1 Tax=Jeotgalibaca sp. MA1X17-3 TaxID=2908211 RepID=UPI001F2C346D|nr:ABC transporter permease [Jeotgalibaca sp. MA1X17-3]UJF15376.1 ABC transporter permease [Jeotgalibaca sp. MA1X17-3]
MEKAIVENGLGETKPGFFKKLIKNKLAVFGLIIIVIVILVALFAPWIATHEPNRIQITETFIKPGAMGHILGTDSFGRDLFSRIVYGARISIVVSLGAVVVGGLIGTVLGLIAGYFGGAIDTFITRLVDGFSAFPFILLAIFLMTILGQGLWNVIFAIGVGNIPGFTRIVRGQVLNVKGEEYIEVQRSLGAGHWHILFQHILPNSMAPLVVHGTMSIAGAIISEASLSFLGLGVQPPTASWGSILKDGKDFLFLNPEIATFSGLAILITVLGINTLGDGIRDALDPKLND